MRKYTHLSKQDRYTIEQMNEAGYLQNQMANCLQRSPATISRELHRNGGLQTYQHHKADRFSRERRQRVPRKITFTAKKKAVVRERLKKWSPDQISNTPEAQGGVSISHERIYKYIFQDKAEGGKLYENVRWSKKKRKKRGVRETRGQIRNQVSIDQRPHSVETKRFYGNWEGDLILGKDHQGALLTLVERKSKYTLIYPLESKESKGVVHAFVEAMKPFKGNIHRITLDNGKE